MLMARFQSRQHQEVVQERVQGHYALLQQRQELGPERFAGVVQLVRDALDDTEIAAHVMHRLTPGVSALIVELSKLFQRVFQILNSSLGFDLLHFGVARGAFRHPIAAQLRQRAPRDGHDVVVDVGIDRVVVFQFVNQTKM